jgi:hypothetical protein
MYNKNLRIIAREHRAGMGGLGTLFPNSDRRKKEKPLIPKVFRNVFPELDE